jgi:glycosyltransferase involved in cell wall biosynthesis
VKKAIKRITRKLGIEIKRDTEKFDETALVSLKPDRICQGNVLLSYIVEPFLLEAGEPIPNTHTHYWESVQIAKTYLDLGYSVDVISYRNTTFVPQKDYSFFIAARTNFQRIAQLLNQDCVKIVHLDTAHWLFNNYAAYKRCLALQQRKRTTLKSHKMVEPNWAIEYADHATILGNQFTISTYRYAQKPMFRIPVPVCVVYPWPEDKNFEACRNHFLWFGSRGLVHKGLDLVLDAFVEMPDYHLTVCGPIQEERDFEKAFYKELYQTSNIDTIGWIDIGSSEFMEITNNCIGLVYPSCSEGGGGSVITCMHAGLIPIVSYEASVDVSDDLGLTLRDCSIEGIKNAIQMVSHLPIEKLKKMAQETWKFARENHTREKFAEEYQKFAAQITSPHRKS